MCQLNNASHKPCIFFIAESLDTYLKIARNMNQTLGNWNKTSIISGNVKMQMQWKTHMLINCNMMIQTCINCLK
jgi:hypothetical protein